MEQQAKEWFRDIQENLVEWSAIQGDVLYRTRDYWYELTAVDLRGRKMVICSRHSPKGGERLIIQVPAEEVPVGKAWLSRREVYQKRIAM